MPDEPDIEQAVADALAGPKKSSGDGTSIENYSMQELIEADKYFTNKRMTGKRFKFSKLVPGDSVGSSE